MKREAHFTTKFRKYLSASIHTSGAYEIKIASKDRFDFAQLQPHQFEALKQVKHSPIFSYKIPDDGLQKPFDLFALAHAGAYVVIAFEQPRTKSKVFILDVDAYEWMMGDVLIEHKRKSVTLSMLESYIIPMRAKGLAVLVEF